MEPEIDQLEAKRELWELTLDPDLPDQYLCRLCDRPYHKIQLNEKTVIYIHRGEDIQHCADSNILKKPAWALKTAHSLTVAQLLLNKEQMYAEIDKRRNADDGS